MRIRSLTLQPPRWRTVFKLLSAGFWLYFACAAVIFGGDFLYGHAKSSTCRFYVENQSDQTVYVTKRDISPDEATGPDQACVVSAGTSVRCKLFDGIGLTPRSKLKLMVWRTKGRSQLKGRSLRKFVPIASFDVTEKNLKDAPDHQLTLIVESDEKQSKIVQRQSCGVR